MILTRKATLKDLASLVDLNKSEVTEWHHFDKNGKGAKASYEELTEWERTMHGGPWMDPQELRRYWSFIERIGVVCLVAEMDNRVIGHLDVLPTRERELGEYLYLDVFIVHRLFRRRGVGTELLKAAESFAAKSGLPRMIVLADYDEPGGLTYRNFGFRAWLEMCTLEASTDSVTMPLGAKIVNLPSEPPLDSHHLICGWFNTPLKLWTSNLRHPPDKFILDNPFDWHRFILSLITKSGIVHFLLTPEYPKRTVFDVCLWIPPSIKATDLSKGVESIKAIAQTLGAETLTTTAFEKDRKTLEDAGFTWIKEHDPLLSKELS
jgi:GNAT superfamily N-acetyltransferase